MGRMGIMILISGMFLLLGSCSDKDSVGIAVPPAGLLSDTKIISVGKGLFVAHCAKCHGSIEEGRTQRAGRFNPQAPDFKERRYRVTLPGYLFRRIEKGRKMEPFNSMGSVMPAWEPHLKPQQIWALVAYIRYRSGAFIPH